MAYWINSCAPHNCSRELPYACGVARKPLACGVFPMLPEICQAFSDTGFIKLFWVFFGRYVKSHPNLKAIIILADSRLCTAHRVRLLANTIQGMQIIR
jgi:hypothetical protein